MPSRRTFLAVTGTGVTLALTGCLRSLERVEGYIQSKSFSGVVARTSSRDQTDILSVSASFTPNDEPPDLTHLNREWAELFPVPRMPVVSDSLHDALTDQFDTVRYGVGTTSPEWADDGESVGSYNVATTRANFNRVQVHNKVTASSDGTSLTIHSVDGVWNFDATSSTLGGCATRQPDLDRTHRSDTRRWPGPGTSNTI